MKSKIFVLALFLPLMSFASSYYCNGNVKQSGTSWYYPNGNVAQSGGSVYYPNGNVLKSGSSLYYRNGNVLQSGSSLYYLNGNVLKSGSSFYHSNGNVLKSGSSCYYENGNLIGTCPRSYNIDLGSGDNAVEAVLNLADGLLSGMVYQFQVSGHDGSLVLEGGGNLIDIRYECSGSVSPDVEDILSSYSALETQKKAQVRDRICGP